MATAGWIYLTVSALIILGCSHANHACQVISEQGYCEKYKPRLARLSARFNGNETHYFPQFVFETELQRVHLAVVTASNEAQRLGRHVNKCVDTKNVSPAVPFKTGSPVDYLNLYVCTDNTDCYNKDCAGECCDYQCTYTIDASACAEIRSTNVPTTQQTTQTNTDRPSTEKDESTTVEITTERGISRRPSGGIPEDNPSTESRKTRNEPGTKDTRLILGLTAPVCVVAIVAILAFLIRRDRNGESVVIINVYIYPHEDAVMPREFFIQLHHALRRAIANQTADGGVRFNVQLMVRNDDRDNQRLAGLSSLLRKAFLNLRTDNDIYILLCPRGTDLFYSLSFPKLLGAYHNRANGQQDWQVLSSLLFRNRFMGRVLVVHQINTEDPMVDAPTGYKYVGELSSSVRAMGWNDDEDEMQIIADEVYSMRTPAQPTPPTEYSLPMQTPRRAVNEQINPEKKLGRGLDDFDDAEEEAGALLAESSVDHTQTDNSVGIEFAPPAKIPEYISMADV